MFDLFREIMQTLRNNKLRTSLTGFSVAWGIFMLIILLGMSRGVFNSFQDHMSSQNSANIQVWGGNTSKPYKGYKEGRYIGLKESDINVVEENNKYVVSDVTGSIYGPTSSISTSKDYISTSYQGVYPGELDNRGRSLSSGRFINDKDLEERRKVMVLSERNAAQLFPDGSDPIGQFVTFNGLSFKIIGIYESRWAEDSYIPFTTAAMLEGNTGNLGSMTVELKNVTNEKDGEEVETAVRTTLASLHNFDPDDQSAVWIWNKFTNQITMMNGLNILNIAIWLIGLFTMLSGIIGVSNIMFVSVRERTHEIGIRRAIGAKPRSIVIQIVMESIAITTLFGYIGIVLGMIVTEILSVAFSEADFLKDPTVNLSIAVQVTVVLVIAGSLAGLFPALKALKVKPVEALRTE